MRCWFAQVRKLQLTILLFLHDLRPVLAPARCPAPSSGIILKKSKVIFGVCLWFPIGHACREVDVTDCCADFWGPHFRRQNLNIREYLHNIGHTDAEKHPIDKVYLEADEAKIYESRFERTSEKLGRGMLWYIYFTCFDTQSPDLLRLTYRLTTRSQLEHTPYYCVRCLPGEEAEFITRDSERLPLGRKRVTARCGKLDSKTLTLPSRDSHIPIGSRVEQQDLNQRQKQALARTLPGPEQLQPQSIVVPGYKRQCVKYNPTEVIPGITLNAALFDHTSETTMPRSLRSDSAVIEIDVERRSASNAALADLQQAAMRSFFDVENTAEFAEFPHATNDLQVTGFYRTTMGGAQIPDQVEGHLISLPAVPSASVSLTAQLNIPAHADVLRDWTEVEPASNFQACAYNENVFNLDLAIGANSFIPANDGYLWPELELPSTCI